MPLQIHVQNQAQQATSQNNSTATQPDRNQAILNQFTRGFTLAADAFFFGPSMRKVLSEVMEQVAIDTTKDVAVHALKEAMREPAQNTPAQREEDREKDARDVARKSTTSAASIALAA